MIMTVILSVFVLIIPVYLVVEVLKYGLMVAWVFATVYVILLGVTFYVRFLGGKWKAMRVIELEPQVPKIRPTKLGRVAKL
jgi:MATE family multidrug resistance protein